MTRLLFIMALLVLAGCSQGSDAPPPAAEQVVKPPVTTPPPPAQVLTWAFSGHLADGGTVIGRFAYNSDTAPSTINTGNTIYALKAWTIVVLPAAQDVRLTFTSELGGNSATLCVGQCLFSPLDLAQLVLANEAAKLQLDFVVTENVLPATLAQWGTFAPDVSRLDGVDLTVFHFTEAMTDGTLTTAPEVTP